MKLFHAAFNVTLANPVQCLLQVGDEAPEENEGEDAEGDAEVTTSTFSLPLKKKKKKKTHTDEEATPEGEEDHEGEQSTEGREFSTCLKGRWSFVFWNSFVNVAK